MTMIEPFALWLDDLNTSFTSEGAAVARFVPRGDVLAGDEGVTVHLDVPGLGAEALEIEVENDVLTVRGERPYPYSSEDGGRAVQRVERGFGRFERRLHVPRGLDPDAIQASLTDGVLTLRIPKPESIRPRRVQIRQGAETRELEGASA